MNSQPQTYILLVYLLMLFEVGARRELLVADRALERFDTLVQPLVSNQIAYLVEIDYDHAKLT